MLDDAAQQYLASFKDAGGSQPLLGCGNCIDRDLCGGLHLSRTGALLVSCMSYCNCEDKSKCDAVCPSKPSEYVRRHQEVDGWELTNIPQAREIPLTSLPDWVALLQGNLIGRSAWSTDDVFALPLTYALIGSGPKARARTRQELQERYGIRPRHGWVLSGTEDDPAVERIWTLPDVSRISHQLVRAGAVFATSPDFSTVLDCPRHDNLHAMKRIAWVWYHMTQGGLCTALHVNGRTDHDFVRWTDFIRGQPAVKAIAFEFLTGSAGKASIDTYCRRLTALNAAVGRDLTLVIRGSAEAARQLRRSFAQVIFIDSTAYMRSTMRRRAFIKANGKLGYDPVHTSSPREVRALLRNNLKRARLVATTPPESLKSRSATNNEQGVLDLRVAPPQKDADGEAFQLSLFSH